MSVIDTGPTAPAAPEQLNGIDHAIVEAIRDENGRPSSFHLTRLVDGFREGQVKPDPDTFAVLGFTEVVVSIHEEQMGRKLNWGEYTGVLNDVLKIDAIES